MSFERFASFRAWCKFPFQNLVQLHVKLNRYFSNFNIRNWNHCKEWQCHGIIGFSTIGIEGFDGLNLHFFTKEYTRINKICHDHNLSSKFIFSESHLMNKIYRHARSITLQYNILVTWNTFVYPCTCASMADTKGPPSNRPKSIEFNSSSNNPAQ